MRQIIFGLLFMFGIAQANSQNKQINLNEVGSALTESSTRNLSFSDFDKAILRSRSFSLNKSLQSEQDIMKKDTLTLDLFSDKKYKAYIENIEKDVNGTLSVIGKLIDYPMGYFIITTSSENNSLVCIEIPELNEKYITRKNPATRSNYLIDVDSSKLDKMEDSPALIPEEDESQISSSESFSSASTRSLENITARIDVMVVYTNAAKNWSKDYEGDIYNTIAQMMSKSKLVLNNSNVGIELNLVYIGEVNYEESSSSDTNLRRLTNHDGYMDNVHQLRDQYGADLVVLLTRSGDSPGIAWVLNNTSGRSDSGFSVTKVSSASNSYTTIHEIGHNIGLGHHKNQNFQPGPGLFPYSAGWRWKGTDGRMYCSVMSYQDGSYFSDKISATRVPYFSNPSINYMGYPTGNATHGDAARSLRQMKHVVSEYRRHKATPLVSNYEPNESFATAYPISTNGNYSAGIGSATDKDFYKFTLSANSNIVTTLSGLVKDYDLEVYNSAKILIGSSRLGGNSSENVTLKNLSAGTYYIVVYGHAGAYDFDAYYTLRVEAFSSTAGCVGYYESNETMATAYPIWLNTTYNAGIGSSTDKDFYKFTLTSVNNVVVTLINLPKDYQLEVYNSSGILLGASRLGGTANESVRLNNLAAGTYYVRIYSYGDYDLNTCYALKVETAVPQAGCSGNYEPNQTLDSAYPISANATYSATLGDFYDYDYYKFTLSTKSNVVVTLQNLSIDFALYLYNSARTPIAKSNNRWTENESITMNGLPAGTYYILVDGFVYDTPKCYNLRVSTTAAYGSSVDDNTERIVTNIVSEKTTKNVIIYPNPAKDILNIKSETVINKVTLTDLSGKIMLCDNNIGNEKSISVSHLSKGMYIVTIETENGVETDKISIK